MKTKQYIILFLILIISFSSYAESKSIQINNLPTTMDEFLKLRNKIAKTPMGGAAMFICAMIMYGQDEELGLQAFTVAFDRSQLSEDDVYKGFKPAYSWKYYFGQVKKFPFLGYIYIQETNSLNGYIPLKAPYKFSFTEIRPIKDEFKLFIKTTSGNMARPLILSKNSSGVWKVKEATSVFVGPSKMPPKKKVEDNL